MVKHLGGIVLPKNNVTESMVITVNFTNSRAFNNKKENITLSLNPPLISIININPVTAKVNEEITIAAIITTKDSTPISTGTVTFTTIDYTETVNVIEGLATTTHIFTQKINDTLNAIYNPVNPDDYYESINTTTITITKDPMDTRISLEAINAKVNQEVTITATVITTDGTPLETGTVTFMTPDYNETVNIIEGVASTTHIFTEALNNILTAIYTPIDLEEYNPSTMLTTINITCLEYTLKVDTTTFTSL